MKIIYIFIVKMEHVTRPDWRTLHIMPNEAYRNALKQHTAFIAHSSPPAYFIKIKRISFWI
jgi:hypothetical protein